MCWALSDSLCQLWAPPLWMDMGTPLKWLQPLKQQKHKQMHMKSPSLSARSYIFRPQLAKTIQESRTCAPCRGKHLAKKRTLGKNILSRFLSFFDNKRCATSIRSFLRRYRAEICYVSENRRFPLNKRGIILFVIWSVICPRNLLLEMVQKVTLRPHFHMRRGSG